MTNAAATADVEHVGDVVISVVDPDDTVRGVLADHVRDLDSGVVAYANLAAFTDSTDPSRPGVVIFGPSESPDEVIPQVAGLIAFRPRCDAIMVVYELTADVLQQALRAGVVDVVAVSAEDAELLDAIGRASARVTAREAGRTATVAPGPSASSPGRIISVFCTKGGTGKSVVAINLAVALAKKTIQPVVLVDADLQFGDVALMLQLQPTHTIAEAAQAGDRLDGTLLENLLLRHPPSGLLVLAAPTEPSSADQIGKADITRVLSVLRERCAYIVVDTSANFAEVTLAALEAADDILVMAGLDVMSLKSARVGMQTMRVLGIPFSRVKFVLNRANTRVGLTEADAERALQLKVDAALPSDILVAESVNRGVPVVTSAPRSKFAKSIDSLADSLMTAAPATAQSRQSV
ncbi:MAG TPA: AAA family ATPase [Acidimicrobiales bacterium]|nr:AAA family ATPase [Acidimicrobiales bacterium]